MESITRKNLIREIRNIFDENVNIWTDKEDEIKITKLKVINSEELKELSFFVYQHNPEYEYNIYRSGSNIVITIRLKKPEPKAPANQINF